MSSATESYPLQFYFVLDQTKRSICLMPDDFTYNGMIARQLTILDDVL